MNKKHFGKKELLWLLILISIGALIATLLSHFFFGNKVTLGKAQMRLMPLAITEMTPLVPFEQTAIMAPTTMHIDTYAVKVGQRVRVGQILVTFKKADIDTLRNQLQSALDGSISYSPDEPQAVLPPLPDGQVLPQEARSSGKVTSVMEERARQLLSGGLITQGEYDKLLVRARASALNEGGKPLNGAVTKGSGQRSSSTMDEASRDAIQAQLTGLEALAADGTIRSPIGGKVGTIYREKAMTAIEGYPIMTIVNDTYMKGTLIVPQSYSQGQREIYLRAYKKQSKGPKKGSQESLSDREVVTLKGIISKEEPLLIAGKSYDLVTVQFANKGDLLNAYPYFDVTLLTSQKVPQVAVPESAVHSRDGYYYVYVVMANQRVDIRRVSIGAIVNGYCAITEGLSADERIITSPGEHILGEKIKNA